MGGESIPPNKKYRFTQTDIIILLFKVNGLNERRIKDKFLNPLGSYYLYFRISGQFSQIYWKYVASRRFRTGYVTLKKNLGTY